MSRKGANFTIRCAMLSSGDRTPSHGGREDEKSMTRGGRKNAKIKRLDKRKNTKAIGAQNDGLFVLNVFSLIIRATNTDMINNAFAPLWKMDAPEMNIRAKNVLIFPVSMYDSNVNIRHMIKKMDMAAGVRDAKNENIGFKSITAIVAHEAINQQSEIFLAIENINETVNP